MTSFLKAVTASTVLSASMLPVHAQSVVGSALIDGVKVELLSDQTWRFAEDTAASRCQILAAKVEFCGLKSIWKRVELGNPQFAATFQYDALHFSGFIIEPVGLEAGITLARLRQAVLSVAATATGVSVSDVPILFVNDETLDGKQGSQMAYAVEANGVSYVFVNTQIVDNGLSFQAVTWTVGQDVSDIHAQIHQQFLDQTQFVEGI